MWIWSTLNDLQNILPGPQTQQKPLKVKSQNVHVSRIPCGRQVLALSELWNHTCIWDHGVPAAFRAHTCFEASPSAVLKNFWGCAELIHCTSSCSSAPDALCEGTCHILWGWIGARCLQLCRRNFRCLSGMGRTVLHAARLCASSVWRSSGRGATCCATKWSTLESGPMRATCAPLHSTARSP